MSSRVQTLAEPSCDHARQSVLCQPWELHETVPPHPSSHHPQHLPCPPAGQRSPLLYRQQLSSHLKPGRGSWDDSGKPLHVAEKPPCTLTVIPKQLLRWQIIFFQIK